jgi:hypothetical protein
LFIPRLSLTIAQSSKFFEYHHPDLPTNGEGGEEARSPFSCLGFQQAACTACDRPMDTL